MARTPPIFGDPKRYLYFWGKGINKQKTNKQIKCVCLVKSAVCDVAFGDRRELLHECAKPWPPAPNKNKTNLDENSKFVLFFTRDYFGLRVKLE